MEEERNELMEQETNQEVAEKTEENQTPVVIEDNFGAGLLIGGGAVLLAGVAVKVVKKLRNKHKTEEADTGEVTKRHWYDRFRKAKSEETDEPIDVEISEVEESEDEEE